MHIKYVVIITYLDFFINIDYIESSRADIHCHIGPHSYQPWVIRQYIYILNNKRRV